MLGLGWGVLYSHPPEALPKIPMGPCSTLAKPSKPVRDLQGGGCMEDAHVALWLGVGVRWFLTLSASVSHFGMKMTMMILTMRKDGDNHCDDEHDEDGIFLLKLLSEMYKRSDTWWYKVETFMSHKSILQLGEGGTSVPQMCHSLSVTRWEMTTLCWLAYNSWWYTYRNK